MVDTTDPYTTLRVQLESLRKGKTKIVYQLASPANRQITAKGGYNYQVFDKMVKSKTYSPLLYFKHFKQITLNISNLTFIFPFQCDNF